jgi:pilus assembly protein CpaF
VSRTTAQFSEDGLLAATRNIAQFVGRVLSEERPRLDARLPDGSRIHIVLPPVARHGAIMAIRKFSKDTMSMKRFIEVGTVTETLALLIDATITLHLNTIIAGGSGSGKTSLLNVISASIGNDERVIVIEDSAELQLQQPGVIALESRPPDKFGKGEVTLAELLNSALRLRPDRIIVGEVRGGEAFSLLQAMNTGHSGSIATTHANTPVDTLRRLESLCLMSGIELPLVAIRAQAASAVNLVICCERFPDGTRKVTTVSEVLPLNDRGEYRVQDLFVFTQTGKNPVTGRIEGYHAPTGILPSFFSRIRAAGIQGLDEWFFDPAYYGLPPPPHFRADGGEVTRWSPTLRPRPVGGPAPVPPVRVPVVSVEAPVVEVQKPLVVESPPAPQEKPTPPPVEAATKPPAPKAPPVRAMRVEEPTIQVSADLLEEMEASVVHEATRLGRNPLSDLPTAPPRPRVEDDKTDPNIRTPRR